MTAGDPDTPEGVARFLEGLRPRAGKPCASCGWAICGHEALMSVMMGFQDAPRCAACLARALGVEPDGLRGGIRSSASARECFAAGWRWASSAGGCGCGDLEPSGGTRMAAPGGGLPRHDAAWDAGDLGCGDLVLDLRMKMRELAPGHILRLTARDPGAPADIPSWCGMTGHTLVSSQPPTYWIQRKEN